MESEVYGAMLSPSFSNEPPPTPFPIIHYPFSIINYPLMSPTFSGLNVSARHN